MKGILAKIYKGSTAFLKKFIFLKMAMHGAALALFIITGILLLLSATLTVNELGDPWILGYYLVRILAVLLIAFVGSWLIRRILDFPRDFLMALFVSVPLIIFVIHKVRLSLFLVLIASVSGASLYLLFKTNFRTITAVKKSLIIFGVVVGLGACIATLVVYSTRGMEMSPLVNASKMSKTDIVNIAAESPASRGGYKVKTMVYGSGNDRHRPEYGPDVDIKTVPVDGQALIDNWSGIRGWWRTEYWGFDAAQLPLNAKVWYPEGKGPFPLALIVHGDHNMQDFSEGGYDYLGELLASRGIILASIDQNFLNIFWSDLKSRLKNENDARAWLLLEHLKVWHEWNLSKSNPFFNKIDTTKLALLGHSKGGEAIAHAALFNQLAHHPDDTSIKFDYHYDIKSLVALAPVDGQFEPAGTRTVLRDINYLVMHGSQDGEVPTYVGSKQYDRISFSDSTYHFKSGLYIHGANHGQFNTSWGDKDAFTAFKGLLNLEQLLTEEDQLKIAKVYISAFLEVTLKEDRDYLRLFKDPRAGDKWLPETIYLNQFEDATTQYLCTFEEDSDSTTTTSEAGLITAENVTSWYEGKIGLKREEKDTKGVFLEWDYGKNDTASISNKTVKANLAKYGLYFPDGIMEIDSTSVLVFSMAEAGKNKEPTNFSISLEDISGVQVHFQLRDFSLLQPKIEVGIWKTDFLWGRLSSENVFQTFSFPIEHMLAINPDFDHRNITRIDFSFDRSQKGGIIIENIGFMR